MPGKKRIRQALVVLFVLSLSTSVLAQEPKEVRITASEFSFKPSKIEVPEGQVRLVVINRGKFPHGLAIVGRDEKIKYMEPGATESLILKFDKPEEVIFYCPQPGHRRKGMEGKLTVGKAQ